MKKRGQEFVSEKRGIDGREKLCHYNLKILKKKYKDNNDYSW